MEITPSQHPRPRPILGVCFPQVLLSTYKISYLNPQERASLALLKYFPKHIDSLPPNLSNLKSRIKRLKLITRIPSDHPNNVLRILLANKRKNVEFASGVEDRESKGGYHQQTLNLLKMLPSLQKVEFCVEAQYVEEEGHSLYQAVQSHWIERMSNYLNHMRNLRYLRLSNHGRYSLPLLSKLNSFERMLSRFQVFRLEFKLFRPEDFPYFQGLLNFKTVLRYLTHLELDLQGQKYFFELYQLLPNYCPRLLSLFSVLYPQDLLSTFQDVSCLKCLQAFQNLQKLSLYCLNKLDIFRHCKFPISLRELDLYFDEVDWQGLVAKGAFYEKQEGLENLEKLQIFLLRYYPAKEDDIISDFIKDLLSRTFTLKEFKIELTPEIQEEDLSSSFDLSRFLSCLQHLRHSLQRLAIFDSTFGKYSFANFLEAQAFDFPELAHLSITGGVLRSLPEIKNLIKLAQTKPNIPAPEIKLGTIKIGSCKSLLELLDSVKKISGKQIELVVFFERKEEDDEYFMENYEKVKHDSRNLRNVSLEIRFACMWPKLRWMEELKSLRDCFRDMIIVENFYL